MASRNDAPTLDLTGGAGTKPKAEAPPSPGVLVYDPTPKQLRELADDALWDIYGALVEYDASGGRVRRKLRRELDRRSAGGGLG